MQGDTQRKSTRTKTLKQTAKAYRGGPERSRASGRRFRDDIVSLHRRIFRQNRTRINSSVHGYSAAFRRYEQAYRRYVCDYQRRVAHTHLEHTIGRARLVYVGDYHTLPQAQEAFLRVLRRLPEGRQVILALEFFRGRHQAAVERYLTGAASEEDLLEAIGYHAHWMLGDWRSFKPIVSYAAERGFKIICIDSAGSGPAGRSLAARDRYAARRIARALTEDPGALVIVLAGELHIAPCHLPREVDLAVGACVSPISAMSAPPRTPAASALSRGQRRATHIAAKKTAPARMRRLQRSSNKGRATAHTGGVGVPRVIVYQNCEKIYWALEKRGLEHEVDLVQIDRDQFCLLNTPPIVCQQSFLNWLDVEEDGGHLAAPEQNFKDFARLLSSFFDLPIGDALDEVEVTTVVDLSFLARLRRRGDFSAADMRFIQQQIVHSESYYIPRANMVYLGNLSVNHAAEEASHFIRHVCVHAAEPKLLVDAFYARCLEEAIGFLGSKVINHRRWCAEVTHFERVARSKQSGAFERELAHLVIKHAKLEEGERARGMTAIYECGPTMFNAVTHAIGYRLGNKLYHGLLSGAVRKQEVRDLFLDTFDEEGSALANFLYFNARVSGVRVPEQF